MGFAVVNIGTNTNASGSGATIAVTVGAAGVPKGCQIWVAVTEKSTTGLDGTLADTAGNAYSTVNSGNLGGSATFGRGLLFRFSNAAALVNGNTITYTKQTSGTACGISAFYVTGATGSQHGLATATGTTGTITVTSGSLSPSDLVIGVLLDTGTSTAGGNATFTNAAGFVTPANEANAGGAANARVNGGNKVTQVTGTVVYNPTLSSTAQEWLIMVMGVSMVPYAAVEDGTAATTMFRQYEQVSY